MSIEYPKKNNSIKELMIFCNGCKKPFRGKCHETGKSNCYDPSKHVYKASVKLPGTRSVKTKIVNEENLDRAIQETLTFKQQVLDGIDNNPIKPKHQQSELEEVKNFSMVELFAKYVAYLRNDGVPEYMVKIRTESHIKDVERHFRYTAIALVNNKIDLEALQLADLNDNHMGYIYSYLVDVKEFSNRSFNKYLTTMNSFYNYLDEIENIDAKNPFRKIKRKKEVFKPISISIEEFNQVIKLLEDQKTTQHSFLSTGEKKLMYKHWMANAFKLFLYTGRRREEVVMMRFSDIVCNEKGNPIYIDVPDYKVSRIKGYTKKEELKKVAVPIHNQLMDLLTELSYDYRKNTDHFIIAPESELTRSHIANLISRSFTHYWKQTGINKEATLRHLRKTYITLLKKHLKGNASLITGHSNEDVINKHYFDQTAVIDLAQNFKME